MKTISQLEATKSVRKNWGQLNPVTKRIDSKKTFKRKDKFQKNYLD